MNDFSKSSQNNIWTCCSQIFLLKNVLQSLSVSIKDYQACLYSWVLILCNIFLGSSYNLKRSSDTAVFSLECNLQKIRDFSLLKEEPYDHGMPNTDTARSTQTVSCFSTWAAFASSKYGSWVPKRSIQMERLKLQIPTPGVFIVSPSKPNLTF